MKITAVLWTPILFFIFLFFYSDKIVNGLLNFHLSVDCVQEFILIFLKSSIAVFEMLPFNGQKYRAGSYYVICSCMLNHKKQKHWGNYLHFRPLLFHSQKERFRLYYWFHRIFITMPYILTEHLKKCCLLSMKR